MSSTGRLIDPQAAALHRHVLAIAEARIRLPQMLTAKASAGSHATRSIDNADVRHDAVYGAAPERREGLDGLFFDEKPDSELRMRPELPTVLDTVNAPNPTATEIMLLADYAELSSEIAKLPSSIGAAFAVRLVDGGQAIITARTTNDPVIVAILTGQGFAISPTPPHPTKIHEPHHRYGSIPLSVNALLRLGAVVADLTQHAAQFDVKPSPFSIGLTNAMLQAIGSAPKVVTTHEDQMAISFARRAINSGFTPPERAELNGPTSSPMHSGTSPRLLILTPQTRALAERAARHVQNILVSGTFAPVAILKSQIR